MWLKKYIVSLAFLISWPQISQGTKGQSLTGEKGSATTRSSPEWRWGERTHTGKGRDPRPVHHEAVVTISISLLLLAASLTATTLLSLTEPKAAHCLQVCITSRLYQHNSVISLKLLRIRNCWMWPCFLGICNRYPLFSLRMSSRFPFTYPAQCQYC